MQTSLHSVAYKILFPFVLLLKVLTTAEAQTCQDASVELSAEVQSSPPRITLSWTSNVNATQHFVYRKLKAGTTWGPVIATLAGTDSTFVDSTVVKGVSYEYQVLRTSASFTGYGYINAGIEIPVIEKRGVIILLIDGQYADSLITPINLLEEDLSGDGWSIVRHVVPRTATVPEIKNLIVSTYNAAPSITKAIFIIGHVPIPYSGEINVDGHGDHTGAYPADVFYADVNGAWTDVAVNNITAGDPRNQNVPEDGKYDQGFIPSDLELQVGRVDFNNMPSFAASELQLLRNYLDKDHAYRKKIFTALHRGVVDDNFGYFGAEAFAASGWKNLAPLVGHQNVKADDYFGSMADSTYLWSYGCGGGWYQGAGGVGSSTDFANAHLQGVFTMLFGSYFGDWDSPDNFLRAALATGRILTNVWSGRPHWQFHHMGLGENIGYDVRLSQNNNGLYFSNFGARVVHMAFMGDPTLRNDIIAPVKNVLASANGYNAQIAWEASEDSVLGYNIYRKNPFSDDYVRINAQVVKGTSFTDLCLDQKGVFTYMVRAYNLQTGPSGSYYNMSEGVFDTVYYDNEFTVTAAADYAFNGFDVLFQNSSTHATSYYWSFGDGESSIEVNPIHTYPDGNWLATLIASNECDNDTALIQVASLTRVTDVPKTSVIIYPNPTDGRCVIDIDDISSSVMEVTIYSPSGQLVFHEKMHESVNFVDLSTMKDGIYFISVRDTKSIYQHKIILQH